jgi:hypothetical protein
VSSYFARIELHGASWPNDYDSLHSELTKIGFCNCMFVIDGQTPVNRRLPTGFYFCSESDANHTSITASVKKAADDTGYSSEIVVIGVGVAISYLSRDCQQPPMPGALRRALSIKP